MNRVKFVWGTLLFLAGMVFASDNRPIGVFDSGTGGLTVLEKMLTDDFAHEKFVYLGDQANMPYGDYAAAGKSDFLRGLVIKDAEFLLGKNAKVIVIACNTATAYGYDAVAQLLAKRGDGTRVIGVVNAGARSAIRQLDLVKHPQPCAIGVLATPGTISSGVYERTIKSELKKLGVTCEVQVFSRGCAGLADAVEAGSANAPKIACDNLKALLSEHQAKAPHLPLKAVILGCTHFPFVQRELAAAAPKGVIFVDPAVDTAAECAAALKEQDRRTDAQTPIAVETYVSVVAPGLDPSKLDGKGGLTRAWKYGRADAAADRSTVPVPILEATKGDPLKFIPFAHMIPRVRALLEASVRDGAEQPKLGTAGERVFGPGTHYLTETQVFTAADSGTVWKAAPGAKPVISGARKVTGWRKAGDGLWCADVPWVTGRENGFRQLTVNGELRPRAKHPNKDYFHSLQFPRPAGVTWFQWEYGYSKMRFRINPGEVDPTWNLSKGEVIFYHIWNDSHCPAASLSVENGTNWLNLAECVRRNPCGCPWRLENLKEIADLPGEWALDYDAKRVYYRPCAGEDPSKAEIAVPFLETLVKIDGAKGVRFEGLAFEDSRYELARDQRNDLQASQGISAAVVLTNATGCTFERCAFRKLSGYAIDFQAGTCDSKVSRCRMMALGAGGVRLNHAVPKLANTTTNLGYAAYQMPDPRVRVRGNEISDCEIGDYGRDFPSAVGVLLMNAEDTRVVHNVIHDGYYTGVSVGWNWGYLPSVARDNLIEYNHIWNIGKGLISDMGGIYLLGIAPGTKVRNNLIHDVDARFYGGWGIYPDEGSSGLLIENNVVYNTKFAAFHQHFGRNNTVRNNIFAGGRVDQLASSRWEPHTRFFFYNNIVFWREGKLHSGNWADDKTYSYLRIPLSFRSEPEWKLKKTTECDYNLYFNPTKQLKDVQWGTQNCSWEDWRGKYLQDAHSVWGDPLFVDEAKHDYRLRPDSPALKLGFRPIDLSTVGPRGESDAKVGERKR